MRVMQKKMLAVDDDSGTREFYTSVFEDAGFIVRTAADATAAIITCEDFNPDILLLDWDMPGGGGRMVFEKICTLVGKKIPVLFVTGTPGKVAVDILASRVSVLKKPANIDTLLAHVSCLFESQLPGQN